MKIAILHPDLGIGGAEQLIVNIALALQKHHYVKIYTPHHDPTHCFPETNGQIPVEVRGNLIPGSLFGYCTALCAYLRMVIATIWILLFGGHYDVYIIDQVTVCLPLYWLFRRKTIFYCHFPDKLLCTQRTSLIKKAYRLVLDTLEELCMWFATIVLVNSQFTKKIVEQAFPIYHKITATPKVLYPVVDFDKFDHIPDLRRQDSRLQAHKYFVSLNRFERKKNIALAIHAFATFKQTVQDEEVRLVIAGGYDTRLQENVQHYEELNQIAERQGVSEYVSFRKNVSDQDKIWLLTNAIAVLYTPEREHFGIVPIEAMYNRVPVIACNSGGPNESISNGETGFLCEPNVQEWSEKMLQLYQDRDLCQRLGNQGRDRVLQLFSFEQFQEQLEGIVLSVKGGKQKAQ